ncbi:hypothetical protein QBC34DRAFT_478350 [Podospora aff. communis PSN243]|uniref:Uncharacterized protein n=1 Tax=Podospora aff. communis PSN243 TaxID=3040156 RepID=A0AAV9G700_9PEZI|nr:hypothetical protein QBC34DRAFT_478350 [Podospora aff. communis PSN243]
MESTLSMAFCVQMYNLADRNMVPALKDITKVHFKAAIKSGWATDDFLLVVADVYKLTPEADRGLRDLVVDISHANLEELTANARFRRLIVEIPQFYSDMSIAQAIAPKTLSRDKGDGGCTERYRCPNCATTNRLTWNTGVYFYCVRCGVKRSDWGSYRL